MQTGFTATMCIFDPIRSMMSRRVWAMLIVIFLIGIIAKATSPLSSPHAPMDHVF
jgi:ABC-type transporter Mla maintaining outer membrane lipid asymmetry permease subunit MlaE